MRHTLLEFFMDFGFIGVSLGWAVFPSADVTIFSRPYLHGVENSVELEMG